jgi:hypothetical protein
LGVESGRKETGQGGGRTNNQEDPSFSLHEDVCSLQDQVRGRRTKAPWETGETGGVPDEGLVVADEPLKEAGQRAGWR